MWATYTARKEWFKAAVKGLEPLGLKVVVLKQTILVDNINPPNGKPRIISSEPEFINFVQSCNIDADLPGRPRGEGQRGDPRTPGLPFARREQSVEPWKSQEPPQNHVTPMTETDEGEQQLHQLVDLGRRMIEQRDAWRRRAVDAESEVRALTSALEDLRAVAMLEKKFESLKHFLAREFHPDYSNADGLEKIIKAELFKRIWPKVEEIDRSH
jgi:hypothetical protein